MSIWRVQLLAMLLIAMLAGCGPPPRLPDNKYANKTEAAVRSELGKPDSEFAGHYGAPPADSTQKFSGEIKTLVFKKGGYDHYVSFEKRPNGWISICSSSVPEGSSF
jgi:hypothetical protein